MEYTEKTIEEFRNPRNMGELESPSGIGKIGNPRCGDMMWLYIDVKKEDGKEVIKDVKVKTFGCVAAIATSSILTEIAKGKTIEEAKEISKQEIVEKLGGLPAQKLHCSVLAVDALKRAIEDYEKKKKGK